MSEVFSILLHNRQRYEQGKEGLWFSLPTTTEKLQEALREIGISADNPQDFFLYDYQSPQERSIKLPRDLVLSADVDELNFLAARLEKLDAAELAELNAALTSPQSDFHSIGQIIDYPDNVDYYVHLPDVTGTGQLGDYYLNRSGMVDMPEEWKAGIFLPRFGLHIANTEHGVFTDYGYLVKSGDEWQRVHEGQPVPEKYRVMAFPAPEILRDEAPARTVQPEVAPTTEAAAPPPVVPIILNSQNSADRMKEITDRLETGIQELFESERYTAYLTSMAKFHSYSFNNTLLIAMQGGQLVAGYNKWRDDFHRNVKRGEKGIKILAPAPYKVKKEMPKLDEQGQPVMDKDGKPLTEVQETQVPAFKIVSVFDVSQTEGEPLPSIGVDELAGNVEQYEDFFKALEQTSPVPMAFEDIPGGSHGYYHLTEKRIAIQENMSELQTLKTAIHEIAHAKLHAIDPDAPVTKQADRPDSRTREVQAESVAYAVCQHYGLDTSDYNKVIWQCVTATKKGKKFCPDSKGIAEETIEQAFIESYRLLCQNNKDVLDEFIARTEETLSDSNASKQLAKVEKDIAALDAKRAKLVDMRLEEIIDKDTYEQKYFDLSSQIEQLQKQRESLQESAETDSTMKKRIAEFRRTLEENEVLDTFDRYVFESIVEKVIVGGYDEDGNKDPSMLTFIYKTGFKSSLDGTNFKPPRKNSKAAKQSAGLCSHTTDEAKSMCSYHSDDTRGVCGEADARIKEVEM